MTEPRDDARDALKMEGRGVDPIEAREAELRENADVITVAEVETIVVVDGDGPKSLERKRFGTDGTPSNVTIRFVNLDARDAACA